MKDIQSISTSAFAFDTSKQARQDEKVQIKKGPLAIPDPRRRYRSWWIEIEKK